MAVVAEVVLRGVSRDQYDAVRQAAGWLAEGPVGGLGHLTWWESDDCHSVDAWEDEAAFDVFATDRLGPAMDQVGVSVEPQVTFHAAHEVFLPRQLTLAATAGRLREDNVTLVQAGYAAFGRQDIPTVLALLDEQINWYTPETVRFGGSFSGRDGVAAFFSRLPENFAELEVRPERFITQGDDVVVLGRHQGRSQTGVSFDVPFVHLWQLRDGKVTTFTEHFDTVRMNIALAVPAQRDISEKSVTT